MAKTNSFATKSDLNKLKTHVDKKFGQVDKRFEQVDKRFGQMNQKFSWFRKELNVDFDLKYKDAFRKFEHSWQQKIDPILQEITKHREKELLHWEQYNRVQKLLHKIAVKVGVDPEV